MPKKMCVANGRCPIMIGPNPKTLLLAYLIRCSPINIFLTSSRPGTACHFLEASTRAGSRHVAFPPPLLPIRDASQQFLDSFHFSLVFSLVIMHSQLQPLAARVHRDLRCPSIRTSPMDQIRHDQHLFLFTCTQEKLPPPKFPSHGHATTKTSPLEKDVSRHPPTCNAHKGQEFGQDRQEIDQFRHWDLNLWEFVPPATRATSQPF